MPPLPGGHRRRDHEGVRSCRRRVSSARSSARSKPRSRPARSRRTSSPRLTCSFSARTKRGSDSGIASQNFGGVLAVAEAPEIARPAQVGEKHANDASAELGRVVEQNMELVAGDLEEPTFASSPHGGRTGPSVEKRNLTESCAAFELADLGVVFVHLERPFHDDEESIGRLSLTRQSFLPTRKELRWRSRRRG